MNSESKPKIVVIGSCCVDFSTYAPRLPKPGETLLGTKFITGFGGKGANQCVAAAKLGGNTYMICNLGDDQWGKQFKGHLKTFGVDVTHVHITPDVTTGMAQISVAENGENQIVIVPGANHELGSQHVQEAKELIKSADVLIAQLETPLETTLEAFKINNGLKLFNAAPASANIQELLPYCSILCVNETEASIITNLNVDISNVTAALERLLSFGCKIVIITLGENGAVYSTAEDKQPIHVLCDAVTPVDTTGAGDAFVGALALYLVTYKDQPLHQIIGAACRVASISVTKEGTQSSFPTNVVVFDKQYKYVKL